MKRYDLSDGLSSATISGMNRQDQTGAINVLLVPLILAVLLLIGAASFGGWAYSSRQDYKNNSDAKVAEAVMLAKRAEDKVKEAQFAEDSKSPIRTYNGPAAYGSLSIGYPKTWSAYVADTNNTDPFVDGYFSPGAVPDTQALTSTFALRVKVVGNSYSQELQQYQSISDGSVMVVPYALPQVPKVVGSLVSGAIDTNKKGYKILLPLRDKTFEIWTESDSYKADFDNYILPNVSFSP